MGENLANMNVADALNLAEQFICEPETLTQLGLHWESSVKVAVVEHSFTTEGTLTMLADDASVSVREALARRSKLSNSDLESGLGIVLSETEKEWRTLTPGYVLKKLSFDVEPGVRVGVAGNFNTPPDVLNSMVFDEDVNVLEALTKNIYTPDAALKILYSKASPVMLENIAGNPSAPPEVLQSLAQSGNEKILEWIAGNPNSPAEVLDRFIDEKSSMKLLTYVSATIKNVELTHKLFQILQAKESNEANSNNNNISAEHETRVALSTLGSNPNAPVSIINILAEHNESLVKSGVARNRSAPVETLKQLMCEADSFVAMELTYNEALPHEFKLNVDFLNRINYIMSAVFLLTDRRTPEGFIHGLVYQDISKSVAEALFVSKFATEVEKAYLFLTYGVNGKADWI